MRLFRFGSRTLSMAFAATWALTAQMVLAGCAQRHPVKGMAEELAEPAEPIVLEIENHNWSDINVFVVHDGRRDRLTTVTAAKDLSIELPRKYQGETGTVQFVVVRIGGWDSYVSEMISTKTGYTVRLTVESDLARSSIGVW